MTAKSGNLSFAIALMVGLNFSTPANAAGDYLCTIETALSLDADGKMVTTDFGRSYLGKAFTVDRHSGIMAGALVNNYHFAPKVLDVGSDQDAFKVLTIERLPVSTNVYVLTVNEYAEGPKKPFVFLDAFGTYSGICEDF